VKDSPVREGIQLPINAIDATAVDVETSLMLNLAVRKNCADALRLRGYCNYKIKIPSIAQLSV
jgi:hypothetical protein